MRNILRGLRNNYTEVEKLTGENRSLQLNLKLNFNIRLIYVPWCIQFPSSVTYRFRNKSPLHHFNKPINNQNRFL